MVGGGCTWSNVKGCFLGPEPVDAAGAEPEPVPVKVAEGDSIVTDVEEVACMTERWKRAGIEVESCVVGGRMRRAATGRVVSTTTCGQTACTDQLAPRLSATTTNSRGPWSLFSSSHFLSPHSHKSERRRLPRVFLTEPLSDDLPPCSALYELPPPSPTAPDIRTTSLSQPFIHLRCHSPRSHSFPFTIPVGLFLRHQPWSPRC